VVAILWRRLRQRLADGTLDALTLPSADNAERQVNAAFGWMDADGATVGECWNDYALKLEHLRAVDAPGRIRSAMSAWASHAVVLDELLETPENIVAALRDAGVSLESMLQRGRGPAGDAVTVVLVTHETGESAIRQALASIAALPSVVAPPALIRIEPS